MHTDQDQDSGNRTEFIGYFVTVEDPDACECALKEEGDQGLECERGSENNAVVGITARGLGSLPSRFTAASSRDV